MVVRRADNATWVALHGMVIVKRGTLAECTEAAAVYQVEVIDLPRG